MPDPETVTAREFEVVVCGGGIAGIEGLLRLRRLAGGRVRITLVSPDTHLAYRPLAVREPFAPAGVRRYPLDRIAEDLDVRWVKARLSSVNRASCTVSTDNGAELPYGALLLATGARESSPYEHAQMFTDRDAAQGFRGIVHDVETGRVGSVAFVLPRDWVWPLPLYELALMTATWAQRMTLEPQISLVTSEPRPLKAFGQVAGEAIERLLDQAGIMLHAGVFPLVPSPRLVTFDGIELAADRIVTLPRITGRAIPGVPAGTRWLVPIDERCVVPGTQGRVFAAGDVTDFPVKHGGIGAQQADTAAAGIAHVAGLGSRPQPLHPVIRGSLLTGDRPLYVGARVIAGLGWQSEVYEQPPWNVEEKIVAEELGGYLRAYGQ